MPIRRLPRRSDIACFATPVLGPIPAGNRFASAGETHASPLKAMRTKRQGCSLRCAERGWPGKSEAFDRLRQESIFSDTHFLRKERRSSAARLALSSGCIKREKIDSAAGHRAALPGHPRLAYSDVRRNTCLLAINVEM